MRGVYSTVNDAYTARGIIKKKKAVDKHKFENYYFDVVESVMVISNPIILIVILFLLFVIYPME